MATILVLLAAVAVLSLVGVGVAAAVARAHSPRGGRGSSGRPAGIKDLLMAVFPESPFAALASGRFLLPIYVLALLLGLAFSHDRSATKPVVLLFDSLSRVFYQINSFFAEFLGVLIIATAAHNVLELRAVPRTDVYRPLLATVGIEALVVALVVMPGALWFFGGKKNPYRVLYALLAPSLAALVSGDLYFPWARS